MSAVQATPQRQNAATGSSTGYRPTPVTLSSLPLQILIYFHGWYFVVAWLVQCLLYIYKGTVLPFPSRNLDSEVALFVLFGFVEAIRLFLSSRGNLTEKKVPLIVALLLSVPILFVYLFLLLWQTYVLRLELVVWSIGIALLILEILLSCYTAWLFIRSEKAL